MKCPQCGQEMEAGYLQALRGLLLWSEKRKKVPFWLGQQGEELVGGSGDLTFIPTMMGWRCRSCYLYLLKDELEAERSYKGVNPFLTDEVKKEDV